MVAATPPKGGLQTARRLTLASVEVSPRLLRYAYGAAAVIWMLTRWLVLVHQGAWPWMNAFVVGAAQGIIAGDWNEAVRPPLPALLDIPFVALGASEDQAIAGLYLVASVIQFTGFVLFIRRLFAERYREQLIALLLFLVVPFNHSIHHYRDIPVVLASSAVFFLGAHWLWASRAGARAWSVGSVAAVLAATALGVWSRTEVLGFIAALVLLGLILIRPIPLRLAILYVAAAALGVGTLSTLDQVAGVSPTLTAQYGVHTFLDSTPESWLTPECRAQPSEDCRDRDGSAYFAPFDRNAGVFALALGHPLLTLEKTVRSALDNLWLLFGINISTYPGFVWAALMALVAFPQCRAALRSVSVAGWCAAAAALAVSIWPLSWAPPHPQYHLQTLLTVAVVMTPILAALSRLSTTSLLSGAFFVWSLALSAFRYTRYSGY